MTLTNILLFLILVTLTTYLFMPWKGKTFLKEKPLKIMKQYIFQTTKMSYSRLIQELA